MPTDTTRLRHGRIELALHSRPGDGGTPLLLLHALHAGSGANKLAAAWTGPVHALDFAGHGESDWLQGGGYSPELFAADADIALAHLADDGVAVCVAGEGVGAYAALLLAGARPDQVRAVLLAQGEGLGEGDGEPDFEAQPTRWDPLPDAEPGAAFDPALSRANIDFQPSDYVRSFAERARKLLLLDDGASDHPAWWRIAADADGSEIVGPDFEAGIEALARHA